MPRENPWNAENSPNPPSNGGDTEPDSPPNSLIEYLKRYTDSLNVNEDDLQEFFNKCGERAILTAITESSYSTIQNMTPLVVEKIGYSEDTIIALVSSSKTAQSIDSRNIRIRSGGLVRFHSNRIQEVANQNNFDFFVKASENRVVAAISGEKTRNQLI